ncbi:unnamed protein product [Ostreobium quekettii]|uniref:SANT domain-containing protein n=1 Tax=Ostreobium quekettii TaxID=121088 RepID=A0A8S1IVU4_9CHLO|nr:unnamed protein product [Ostreobium quekettii]
MVAWVRQLAQDVGSPEALASGAHDALHVRYGGDLLRARRRGVTASLRDLREQRAQRSRESTEDRSEKGRPRFRTSYARFFVEDSRMTGSCSEGEGEEAAGEGQAEPRIREGVEYQAEIPTWRPRAPGGPAQGEAKWFTAPVWPQPVAPADENRINGRPLPRPTNFLEDLQARQQWVDESSMALEEQLGSAAKVLGLQCMGSRVRRTWSGEEEMAFETGLNELGRDFTVIQQDYVPSKTLEDVILYYYNIWKTRWTEAAQRWYAKKRHDEMLQIKQQEEDQKLADELRRVVEERKEEQRIRRNQKILFSRVLVWFKNAAKDPLNANNGYQKLAVERARRAASVTRKEAPRQQWSVTQGWPGEGGGRFLTLR